MDANSAHPETLPLSASAPPATVEVEFEITRASRVESVRLTVPHGTLVRTVLRSIGQAPEGCAVLEGERPLPLDTPLMRSVRLLVVPTFSGG